MEVRREGFHVVHDAGRRRRPESASGMREVEYPGIVALHQDIGVTAFDPVVGTLSRFAQDVLRLACPGKRIGGAKDAEPLHQSRSVAMEFHVVVLVFVPHAPAIGPLALSSDRVIDACVERLAPKQHAPRAPDHSRGTPGT
jgi:hypothetical protein